MPYITLEPVTVDNWKACIALSVHESQLDFVPTNLYSIAEAQFYPEARPLAIYNESGTLIGFTLYGRDVITQKWKVFRLMIDAAHQGRGYGCEAMRQIIAEIARQPAGDEILICYHDANEAARRLYARLGFVEQDVDDSGKVTALLRVSRYENDDNNR
jgi:diamine N-acetyltransferase